MDPKVERVGLGRICVLVLASLLVGVVVPVSAAEREKSVGDLVNIAKNRNQHPEVRTNAIEKLGGLTEAGQIRDNNVGDELISIARSDPNKPDDMFVRIAAIKALSALQQTVEHRLKDKYIPALIAVLKDTKEHVLVRKAVADLFGDTIENDPKDHQGIAAYEALLEIARSKIEKELLRVAAVKAIGAYGSLKALDVLVGMLTEPEPRIREEAAGALFVLLGKLGGSAEIPVPAINKLIEMVGDQKMAADLRVNVMKVLAQLIRDGNRQSLQAMPKIVEVVARNQEVKLVKGGIQALGIIGSAEAVAPLKQAYLDFLPAAGKAPAAPAAGAVGAEGAVAPAEKSDDTDVRREVMRALVSVLSTQATRPQMDMKAVHDSAQLLVKAVDDDPSTMVKEAAIFAMRYLYPVKFKAEQWDAVDALIFLMRAQGTADATKLKIAETLTAITGQDFFLDVKRWDDWFEKNGPRKARAPKEK